MLGSLQSEAKLQFSLDAEGRTILSRRKAGGLCHLSKPYWDGKNLGLQIVNPTAGLFAGDEMGISLELEKGARVIATSPSASRYYAMDRTSAKIRQRISVAEGACLEYHPNWVVPQGGSDVEQLTQIEIEKGGQLMLVDQLAPGRVKHGEQHRYRQYQTQFELRYAGKLAVSERMVLEPDQGGWPLAVPGWITCFYAAVWLVKEEVQDCLDALAVFESRQDEEFLCGLTQLSDEIVVLRCLAARSVLMKSILTQVRHVVVPHFPNLSIQNRLLTV